MEEKWRKHVINRIFARFRVTLWLIAFPNARYIYTESFRHRSKIPHSQIRVASKLLASFVYSFRLLFCAWWEKKSKKTKGTWYIVFHSPGTISRITLQPSARTVIFPVSRTNSTIIQVKAACDGDNMRIVAELNTNTILQYRLDCIKQMVADVFPMETFAQRHFEHYSF